MHLQGNTAFYADTKPFQSLNNLLYWSSQIFGSILTGFFLDSKFRRRMRAWVGLAGLGVLVVGLSPPTPILWIDV